MLMRGFIFHFGGPGLFKKCSWVGVFLILCNVHSGIGRYLFHPSPSYRALCLTRDVFLESRGKSNKVFPIAHRLAQPDSILLLAKARHLKLVGWTAGSSPRWRRHPLFVLFRWRKKPWRISSASTVALRSSKSSSVKDGHPEQQQKTKP